MTDRELKQITSRNPQVLAIDPGTEQSAFVLCCGREIKERGIIPNDELRVGLRLNAACADVLAIEMVASYGMPVGKTVFETVLWIGRFIEAWGGPYRKVYRTEVKMHLCRSTRAKDSNIRQAILDLYPRTGAGKTPQVGTKKKPGPLYGIKKDLWAALGVALAYQESSEIIPATANH